MTEPDAGLVNGCLIALAAWVLIAAVVGVLFLAGVL